MKKRDILDSIDSIYEYHSQQLEEVMLLVLEGERVQNPTPVDKEQCLCGAWIYKDAVKIKKLIGIQFYDNMKMMHEHWHHEYESIYALYYQDKQSRLKRLFSKPKKITKAEREEALRHYMQMKSTTKDLLLALTTSKRRVLALSERCFESVS